MTVDWGVVISCLCTLILAALGWMTRRLSRIEEKLDGKVDKAECGVCRSERKADADALWKAHGRHSHTGLEPDSRVIR